MGGRRRAACAVAVTALAAPCLGEIPAHRVGSLPGLVQPLPTRHWSGYIDVPVPNGTAHVHYWLVENAAKRPDAPTVVWQQGGPGSSSLMGFLTENGPLTVNDESFNTAQYEATGVPTVFQNPHSWHTAPANMLYVEHPAPTGFSYCTPSDACNWTDENQAVANYGFYVRFFAAYPELAANDFYMTGESYAGVLVPTVALQFLKHRNDTNRNLAPWSLKGFALGNDCPGNRVFTCTPYSGWIGTQVALDFRFQHGMISEPTYRKINAACAGHWGTYDAPPEPCKSLLEDPIRPVMSEAGDTYDMGGGYFLYDTCSPDLLALGGSGTPGQREAVWPARQGASARAGKTGYTPDSGEYACGQERGGQLWLNLPEVQEALHVVLSGKQSFSWSTGIHYNKTWHSLLDEYNTTLLKNYRVMQYSGDADPCVPYVGTQRWIESLQLPVDTEWHPWQAEGTIPVSGYATVYGINNFTFATIRDAGHMVPRYKPKQMLHLFTHFLNNQPL
eukprot:TRINITY_DN5666_c0_g1_i1.p2 TRINITY_DN5666_c0_g1~~TRINITY_DN5666_c0_g1_i1.p2  ORF type:complete len:503 (+),score=127.94 TRINITY_DN5666_c0_g1_i1:78-1586(+)